MMLGFVVRQCAAELGHTPDPTEFAEWANHRRGFEGSYCVFGRQISADEARIILRHPERVVAIHPDWAARRAAVPDWAARVRSEPATVLEFRPLRRAR